MKFEVKVVATIHCATAAQAVKVIERRLHVKKDAFKVKRRKVSVEPRRPRPWDADDWGTQ